MKLINNIESIDKPFKNAIITIGNFDGVHMGHKALFREVINKAREIDGTSLAMTFEPHPNRVLKNNWQPSMITLYEQKVELLDHTGIDVLLCIPFSKYFASIPAEEFVKDLLVKRIGIKAIIVGNDYVFGENREGNLDMLKDLGQRLEFEVIIKDWIKAPNDSEARISSTRIRKLLKEGKLEEARLLLGRHYQIRGTVVTGQDRGARLLGFPTANIMPQDELAPKNGVYAVSVECLGEIYQGVANIGFSPTFNDGFFTLEVHILDFNKDIYGEKIRVNFVKRIRNEKKFSTIEELVEKINRDILEAREIFGECFHHQKVNILP